MSEIFPLRRPLVWTEQLKYRGTLHDLRLDLRKTRLKALARELGGEWFEVVTHMSLAHSTIGIYASSIRSLLSYAESYPVRSNLSLADEGEDFCSLFYDWEVHLKQSFPMASRRPFQVPNTLLSLLKWRLAAGRALGHLTTARAQGSALNLLPPEQPLDEFQNHEFQALRDAARNVVRRAEKRVERGNQLASEGQDPSHAGWTIANVLWSIKNQPLKSSGLLSKLCGSPDLDASVHKYLDVDPGLRGSALMIRSLRLLCDQISPTGEDLQAFRILLLSESGWSPEELTDVHLKDLEWGDGDLSITATKKRSDRTRTVKFKNGRSNWTTSALVRRLLALTLPIRTSFGGEMAGALFVRARGTLQGIELQQERFLAYRLADFISDHSLRVGLPHDIRRIRKTHKTLEGALMGTARGAAGDDHSVAVSQQYYMQTSTIKVLAGRAVNGAQWRVFDKVENGPAVLTVSAAEASSGSTDQEVANLASEIIGFTLGDAELAVTTCRNLFNSPWSKSGTPCHVRPTMCFICPNALILLDHLPRIIKFQETIEEQRKSYEPEQFNNLWGATLVNIGAILNAFTAEQVEEAHLAARSPDLKLHVPLSQQVRFQ